MTVGVPKPTARPLQTCPNKCGKRFRSLKRLAAHVKKCGQPKKQKYGAKRTVTAGGAFPSALEARTHLRLLVMKAAGEYADVERYPTVELLPGLKWKVDFRTPKPDGNDHFHEAKGAETGEYRIKKTVWAECGPAPLYIWKADKSGEPKIVEVVVPRTMRKGGE